MADAEARVATFGYKRDLCLSEHFGFNCRTREEDGTAAHQAQEVDGNTQFSLYGVCYNQDSLEALYSSVQTPKALPAS